VSAAYAGLIDQAVCMIPGCSSNAECHVTTSTTCNTQTLPCPSGQLCIPLSSATKNGRCAKPGNCDTKSNLCAAHTLGKSTAKVGDSCKDDTECAGNMVCMFQRDTSTYLKPTGSSCSSGSECCSGKCSGLSCTAGTCTIHYRNGYCAIQGCTFSSTLTIRACPSGSTCNNVYIGGMCQKTCDLLTASTCRGSSLDKLGDYECRAWNNLYYTTSSGKLYISSVPVCDYGPSMPCTFFQSSGYGCDVVGLSPNSTSMSCRDLKNTVLSQYDPTGFCTARPRGLNAPPARSRSWA
jgi:hypothetical protein